MIPRLHHALLALALAAHAGAQDATLRFLNQDRLGGTLASLGTDELVWDSPILEKPTPFFLAQVFDLMLPGKIGGGNADASHEATVALMNGDSVRGQLASVTDDVVELDTWYAGRIRFNRKMVRDLQIDERPDFIYRGPDGLDGWTPSADPSPWRYSNSAFVSRGPGGIATEPGLPDEFALSFEAAWRGGLRLNVILFSDNLATDRPENGYEIVFQRRSVHLRKCGSHNWIGHTSDAGELQQDEKATIRIRASARTGQVCFYLNDRIVDVWTDLNPDAAKLGKGIHFISQDNSPVRISRIEVSKWDGTVDEMPNPRAQGNMRFGPGFDEPVPTEPEPKPEADRMLLRNGDSLKGEVTSIKDGKITLKTEFAEIPIPVERLRNITLKPVDLEEPKRYSGDVRAWFADGSSMVFRLEKAGDGMVTGFSQNFGTADFDMSAFNRIEFNIHDPDLPQLPPGDDW